MAEKKAKPIKKAQKPKSLSTPKDTGELSDKEVEKVSGGVIAKEL